MSHYAMLSKYGNCTRLLKIKNKLWAFLIKQLFPSRLLDICDVIANPAIRASLATHLLISNTHSWNNS